MRCVAGCGLRVECAENVARLLPLSLLSVGSDGVEVVMLTLAALADGGEVLMLMTPLHLKL
jgi:hypothetical protein